MKNLFYLITALIIMSSCGVLKKDTSKITKESLTETKWMWKETILANKTEIIPSKHKSFISFSKDDKLGVGSDCNEGSAFYKLKNGIIEISPIMSTKMYCGNESTEKKYFSELKQANKIFINDNELHITLKDNSGEMIFVK